MAHRGRILRNERQILLQVLTTKNKNCKSNPTNRKLVKLAVLQMMFVPGGQLMLVPLEIFSLGLLPCPQLSGGTRGLVGDSEVDIRL